MTIHKCDACGKTYETAGNHFGLHNLEKQKSFVVSGNEVHDLCDGCATIVGNVISMMNKQDVIVSSITDKDVVEWIDSECDRLCVTPYTLINEILRKVMLNGI